MGAATFVAMIAGFVRAKFLAVTLGPEGVGIFSQAMTFFQSVDTVCGLGISLGVTKYAAEAFKKRDFNGLKRVVSASVILQSISFIIVFIFVSLFIKQISQFVFSSLEYSRLLLVVTCSVLFSAILVSLESVILGMGRSDIFSTSRIFYNLIGVAVLISLVSVMKLTGSFLYILANSLISILIVAFFLVFLLKSETGRPVRGMIKGLMGVQVKPYATKLISYGTVMLIISAITWLSILYVRSLLIRHEGAAANGLYQVVFALVSYYAPFFTNGVWGYLFPKLSAVEKMSEFNFEVNRALRFIILFVTPAIAVIFLSGRPLVIMIFSEEFLGSLGIFPLYLMGSLFYMIAYIFGSCFLARKQLKPYLVINLIQNMLYILIFAQLVNSLGLFAIAVSYCVMNIFGCLASAVYQIWRSGLRVSAANVNLFILSLISTFVVFFLPFKGVAFYIFKWIAVAAWMVFVVGKKEKVLLFSSLRRGGS